jgi:hypothetical protein
MGLLNAFQLGEALRLPFLHADLLLGELRGEAFGLGLFGEAGRSERSRGPSSHCFYKHFFCCRWTEHS